MRGLCNPPPISRGARASPFPVVQKTLGHPRRVWPRTTAIAPRPPICRRWASRMSRCLPGHRQGLISPSLALPSGRCPPYPITAALPDPWRRRSGPEELLRLTALVRADSFRTTVLYDVRCQMSGAGPADRP